MFGLSLGHLLVLSVVVLLFGAKRLPELGSAIGKGIRGFKKGIEGQEDLKPSLGHKPENEVREPDEILPAEKSKDNK